MTISSRRTFWVGCICQRASVAVALFAVLSIPFSPARVMEAQAAGGARAEESGGALAATVSDSGATSAKPASRTLAPMHPLRSSSIVKSRIALVVDAHTSEELLAKNADRVVPIASITKLMTAMVVLDAKLPLEEKLKISDEDRDLVMATTSRLHVGWTLTREDMLHLALMSSENRAAAALSRYYPGGRPGFIAAMNAKARELGMTKTHFISPNGLTNENVSTAFDLVKLVRAADQYPLIRQFTTDPGHVVRAGRHTLEYMNSNRLVGHTRWDIEVQKTGFTNEAGDCVVMELNADGHALIMVFLDAVGKLTRFADARRVVAQLELAGKKPTTYGRRAQTSLQ